MSATAAVNCFSSISVQIPSTSFFDLPSATYLVVQVHYVLNNSSFVLTDRPVIVGPLSLSLLFHAPRTRLLEPEKRFSPTLIGLNGLTDWLMSFLMDNFNLQPRGASPHLGGSLLTEPPSSSAITMGDETGPSSQTPRHAPNLSHRLNPPREAINRLIMNYLVTGKKEDNVKDVIITCLWLKGKGKLRRAKGLEYISSQNFKKKKKTRWMKLGLFFRTVLSSNY